MRTIPISKFKAHALALVKAIAETGESVVVTKRGVPLVCVEPYAPTPTTPQLGKLAGTVVFADGLSKPEAALPQATERGEK
jgi:prevent-host-death family protein